MANGLSSEIERNILNFLFLIVLYKILRLLPVTFTKGFPFLSFLISISLKLNPFEIPVPRDLEKASLAANLEAKQE